MPYHGKLDCYYSMFCVERKHKTVATLYIASYVCLEPLTKLPDVRASDDMFISVVSQLSSE